MKKTRHVAIASMVASLFAASGCGTTPEVEKDNLEKNQQAIVKCAGINSCAGQGACAGASPDGGMNDCAGKNSCAGQGWIEVSSAECTAKGGSVVK